VTLDIPYYVHTREQLRPFLVEEVILNVDKEKTLVQQEVNSRENWKSVKEKLLPCIAGISGIINRQTPWGIPLSPLEKEEKIF
jgi:hypothetical protein